MRGQRRFPPLRHTLTTTPPPSRRTRRARLLALPVLAVVLVLGSLAGPGVAAARDCGDDVVGDWYDNGRVDKIYPLHCYDDAIDGLPVDVVDYSSAKEDIQRALQLAIRGKLVPKKDTHDPTPGGVVPGKDRTGTGPTSGRDSSGGSKDGVFNDVLDKAGSNDASSVPIPLIVLGSIAGLLVLAGSAGYVVRRVQARRLPG